MTEPEKRLLTTVKKLLSVLLVCTIISFLGGSAAVYGLVTRTQDLQSVAYKTAYQRCNLIVGILHAFHTPGGRANATLILDSNPALKNCRAYAKTNS